MEKETSVSISIADIKRCVPDPSPAFRIWIWKVLGKPLNQIVKGLILGEAAADTEEALQILNQMSHSLNPEEMTIACCDLENKTSTQKFNLLNELLDGTPPKDGNSYQFFGTISHSVISRIFSGEVFRKIPPRKETRQLSLFKEVIDHAQLELFPELLFPIKSASTNGQTNGGITASKTSKIWKQLTENRARIEIAHVGWLALHQREIDEMAKFFYQFFPKQVAAINQHRGHQTNRFLRDITLLSWVSALLYVKEKGEKILFPEIAVLPKTERLGGGRIDALEVVAIDDQAPSKKQLAILRELADKNLFKTESVSEISHDLTKLFKSSVTLEIIDWKFSVGDGKGERAIAKEEVPLADHVLQLQKYLTLSSLSASLKEGRKEDFWSRFPRGSLFYFFPDTQPVIHEIETDSIQKEALFLEEIVNRLTPAERRSIFRSTNNLLVGYVINLLAGKKKKSANGNGNTSKNGSLFSFPPIERPILRIIKKYQAPQFLDKLELIEKKSRGRLVLHFDKLLDLIEEGKIRTKGFRLSGGFIDCLAPDHSEDSPSFHINLAKGIFKCFGCGISGKLLISDQLRMDLNIPEESRQPAQPGRKTRELIIPEKHHQTMSLAQAIMQSRFESSPAKPYLLKRGLDPEIAASFGAGFADNFLIDALMDNGIFLDELIFYGFVGISERITPYQGLGPIFKKRGFREKDIEREVTSLELRKKAKREKKTVMGYPFSMLDKRVTFPLTLAGKITNFYGRAAYDVDKRFRHRKLSIELTNVPQGGFNLEALTSENKQLLMTESIIDALSLIELGQADERSVLSVIGTTNYLIIDVLAGSGKEIGLALNDDEGGQKATKKITEYIKSRYPTTVEDFTKKFISLYPEMAGRDYNEFLLRTKGGNR